MLLRGLYGISDENLTPYEKIFDMLEPAILGGMKIFQFRDKSHSDDELYEISKKLCEFCTQKDVLFVMNDRVELAAAINAPALHIGLEDCDFKRAKEVFDGIIGVSCYNCLESAQEAQKQGADYVAFGAFFSSNTKPNAKKADLEILEKAKKNLEIPICGIGGISSENADRLKRADMIAVIGGLWNGNIQKNAERLIERWRGD